MLDESSAESTLAFDLEQWAVRTQPDRSALLLWAQGYNFPPVGHDEEPFSWLIRGLLASEHPQRVEAALVAAMRDVLGDWPTHSAGLDRPDQALFNLLQLAAAIAEPVSLFPALQRFSEKHWPLGDWLGADLAGSLRAALTENQTDKTLREVWLKMIGGHPDPYLKGLPADGFRGLRSRSR